MYIINYYICEKTYKIMIKLNTGWSVFDNAKNAAEACFLLLRGYDFGINIVDVDYEEPDTKIKGTAEELYNTAKNYSYKTYSQLDMSLFEITFYEEIHLLLTIEEEIDKKE